MTNKTPSTIEVSCKAMLKAASIMPEQQQSIDHVTEQAGLIADQQSEPLAVAELELLTAQKELAHLSETLEKLRRERLKHPHQTYLASTQEKEKDGE